MKDVEKTAAIVLLVSIVLLVDHILAILVPTRKLQPFVYVCWWHCGADGGAVRAGVLTILAIGSRFVVHCGRISRGISDLIWSNSIKALVVRQVIVQ